MSQRIEFKPIRSLTLKQFTRRLLGALGIFAGLVVTAGIYLSQPTCSRSEPSSQTVDFERMKENVRILSVECHPRSFLNSENLNRAADLISYHFEQAGGTPEVQPFETKAGQYKNIRCIFGKGTGRRIVIGAHYDSFGTTPGADDNASGVAGLIELAYLVGASDDIGEVELVAYSLEEPPFFGTEEMGSFFHAQSLVEEKTDVQGVIVLEMIGYYTDQPDTQKAPIALLNLIYPSRGNFIFVAGRAGQRNFIKQIKTGMKGTSELDVFSISAPRCLPGIDFSDHRNYWPLDINAVMITDTAFFRNKAYHSDEDTFDRLDYRRMGDTVIGVYNAIKTLRKDL